MFRSALWAEFYFFTTPPGSQILEKFKGAGPFHFGATFFSEPALNFLAIDTRAPYAGMGNRLGN